jgi:uncharacterized membrane protein
MVEDKIKEPQKEEIQEGKVFALISYIFILCIAPLIFKKNNKFSLYHAKQGLVLFIIEVAAFIFGIIPLLGHVFLPIVIFICGIFSLWGMLQSLKGNYCRLPLVSYLASKIII